MADMIDEAVYAVDNKIDGLVGVRPLGAVKRVVDKLVPANLVEGMTGIPKPHNVLDDMQDKVESGVGGIIR